MKKNFFGKILFGILFVILTSGCSNYFQNSEIEYNTPEITNSIQPTELSTRTPHPIEIGRDEMMEVVNFIEKFHSDNGYYPATINSLIPDYLDEVPYTFDGHEITYKKNSEVIYMVEFLPTERKYCSYIKSIDNLECGFINPEPLIIPTK